LKKENIKERYKVFAQRHFWRTQKKEECKGIRKQQIPLLERLSDEQSWHVTAGLALLANGSLGSSGETLVSIHLVVLERETWSENNRFLLRTVPYDLTFRRKGTPISETATSSTLNFK